MKNIPSVEKIKDWIFPGIISLLSFLLWNTVSDIKDDIAEVKKDVKTLMAGYNVDHTRIDGLERAVFKISPRATAQAPIPTEEPELTKRVAIIPKNELAELKWD